MNFFENLFSLFFFYLLGYIFDKSFERCIIALTNEKYKSQETKA